MICQIKTRSMLPNITVKYSNTAIIYNGSLHFQLFGIDHDWDYVGLMYLYQ